MGKKRPERWLPQCSCVSYEKTGINDFRGIVNKTNDPMVGIPFTRKGSRQRIAPIFFPSIPGPVYRICLSYRDISDETCILKGG